MKIGVVILNYNGRQNTLSCLRSVENQKQEGFELDVIVVDNASTDDSVEKIKDQFSKVHILVNSENLGYSEGNNVGIRYALKKASDFIFIINNDTRLDEMCITHLYQKAQEYDQGGIFGPKIYFSAGHEYHKENYSSTQLGKVIWYAGGKIDWDNVLASHRGVDEVDRGQYDLLIKTPFVSGCAMFIRRIVFEKIGMFDQKLFLYYEDFDLCKRAQKAGFEIYYVPGSVMWHKNANTSGGSGSDLQNYYLTRNRLLIGLRYAPWRAKMALFREAAGLLMNGTATQRQAVGDFLRKKYGKRTNTD